MKKTKKRSRKNARRSLPAVIIGIIAAALVLGIAVNVVWELAEKATHPYKYYDHVTKYAEEYNVPESVIYAVIKVESNFDRKAESSVGARGLMQMMEPTFEWLAGEEHLDEHVSFDDIYDAEVSIRYGTYYLNYLYKKFNYNWDTALAAYNGGEGNVAKWLKDSEYSDDGVTLKDIPFKETKNYVAKVNDAIDTYKKLYYDQNEVK